MINTLLRITHLPEYDSELNQTLRLVMLELPFKYFASMLISLFQGGNPQEFNPVISTHNLHFIIFIFSIGFY